MSNLKSLGDFNKEIKKLSKSSLKTIVGGKIIIRGTQRSGDGKPDSVQFTYDEDGHLLGTTCLSGC